MHADISPDCTNQLLKHCVAFQLFSPATAIAVGQEESPSEASREITLRDVIAGVATIENLYGKLDESVVPDAIGYDEAVKKQHVARLYSDGSITTLNLSHMEFVIIGGCYTAADATPVFMCIFQEIS